MSGSDFVRLQDQINLLRSRLEEFVRSFEEVSGDMLKRVQQLEESATKPGKK